MKKVFFVVLLTLSIKPAFAQKIYFTDTTNTWFTHFKDDNAGISGTPYYYYSGSFYNGLYTYYYLSEYIGAPGVYFVREDTIGGVVYINPGFPGSSDSDRVLYNYNLHAGDTIHFTYGYRHPYSYYPYIDSVIWVDSILIRGVYHKVFSLIEIDTFYIHDIGYNPFQTYIEGIGSVYDPVCNIYDSYHIHDAEMLFCFSTGAGVMWDSPAIDLPYIYPSYGDTAHFINDCAPLKVPEIVATSGIKVWPDPATDEVNIQVVPGSKITLYNTAGQIRTGVTAQKDVEKIDVANLPPEIYFVQIINPLTRERTIQKLMKL